MTSRRYMSREQNYDRHRIKRNGEAYDVQTRLYDLGDAKARETHRARTVARDLG